MNIDGYHFRSIWVAKDGWGIELIDQTLLPHRFLIKRLETLDDAATAIRDMWVRGAPLIGATAAYGLCLALRKDTSDEGITQAGETLLATRPTAINLRWALDSLKARLLPLPESNRIAAAYEHTAKLCDTDVTTNASIGDYGHAVIRDILKKKQTGNTVNILTHCNAGWLATVDWGTALAPIYKAHDAGISVHVWVDETRPRNQGANLTAWELGQHGVPHRVIVDNAGGHIMQQKQIDLCIVGTDRTAANGDVCNKIGTYLKALAAKDNHIPFYVALPGSTIDWSIKDGLREIPIEERNPEEITHLQGKDAHGNLCTIQLTPDGCHTANPAFDVTPAHLVTGLITERGICKASREGLSALYPEQS
jgi:methylthioribose-1-phosphate isomerase